MCTTFLIITRDSFPMIPFHLYKYPIHSHRIGRRTKQVSISYLYLYRNMCAILLSEKKKKTKLRIRMKRQKQIWFCVRKSEDICQWFFIANAIHSARAHIQNTCWVYVHIWSSSLLLDAWCVFTHMAIQMGLKSTIYHRISVHKFLSEEKWSKLKSLDEQRRNRNIKDDSQGKEMCGVENISDYSTMHTCSVISNNNINKLNGDFFFLLEISHIQETHKYTHAAVAHTSTLFEDNSRLVAEVWIVVRNTATFVRDQNRIRVFLVDIVGTLS